MITDSRVAAQMTETTFIALVTIKYAFIIPHAAVLQNHRRSQLADNKHGANC